MNDHFAYMAWKQNDRRLAVASEQRRRYVEATERSSVNESSPVDDLIEQVLTEQVLTESALELCREHATSCV